MKGTKWKVAGLPLPALAFAVAGMCGQCCAQDTNFLDALKGLYAFDSWVGRTKVLYQQTVTNWVPDFASLGVTNVLWRSEGVWSNGQKSSEYRFTCPDSQGVQVRLQIWERQDVTNADLAMLQWFNLCAAAQPFPLGPPLGVDIGDRCYLSWGVQGRVVSFVRNNICVCLSASGDYSVLTLAEKLDSAVVVLSFTGPVLLQAGLAGSTFYMSIPTVTGKTYLLESSKALTNWSTLTSFAGDGTIRQVATFAGPGPGMGFFRLRVQ